VHGIRIAPGFLGALLFLAACGGGTTAQLAPASELPAFLAGAAPRVREAYQFALANPHALDTVPCYCGCGNMGHTSNLACFLQDSGSAGAAIAFDEHAANCGICVDIAQDVQRMTEAGETAWAIRQYVDLTYASFGPATYTPLPVAP
jgi:hypothetical protein